MRRSDYKGLSLTLWRAVADHFGPRQAQAEIAKKLKLARAAISARLRGFTNWKAEEVQAIADWLGMPIGALYNSMMKVPVMGSAAANPKPGLVREVSDEPEEYVNVPQKLIAFNVYDSSMEPLARPGQKIFVSPGEKVLSGDLVVANIIEGRGSGAWLFKRFERQRIGKGWKVLLQSIAPGFPTIVLKPQFVKMWKVIGLWLLPSTR